MIIADIRYKVFIKHLYLYLCNPFTYILTKLLNDIIINNNINNNNNHRDTMYLNNI